LFIAMLAVGPLAILPTPVLATLPTYNATTNSGSFVVTNGSVGNVTPSGSSATIPVQVDRSVLVWGAGAFTIGTGETYNFVVPTGGAVLNKVGYTTTGALAATDTATIAGTLLSTGRVFVLANGNIIVGSGATINTSGGLVLSTLPETSDFNFTTGGNLSFSGAPAGNIALGNTGGSAVSVTSGGLSAWSGAITINNITVTGDTILNQTTANGTLALTGSGGPTIVQNGNLSVTTANGSVTQNTTASNSLVVANGNTTISTTNNTVTLTNAANDFGTVLLSTGNASASVSDANAIILGNSTVGGLTVAAGNSISTSGAVAVGTNATLTLSSAGNISFGNGSSVGNTINATAFAGSVTINTVGNLPPVRSTVPSKGPRSPLQGLVSPACRP